MEGGGKYGPRSERQSTSERQPTGALRDKMDGQDVSGQRSDRERAQQAGGTACAGMGAGAQILITLEE